MKKTCLLVALFATTVSAQTPNLFERDNLVAWCIVPFDAKKRGPEDRVWMLKKLGFTRYAYDWRAEHLPTFDRELALLKEHGIALQAVWFPANLGKDARAILDLLKKHQTKTELWVMLTDPAPGKPQAEKVAAAVGVLRPVAEEASKLGCRVGLYNHGNWFGEPENQIEVLKALARPNVGIVYNLHHGHDHIDRFPSLLKQMLPHLYAVNLNGTIRNGDRVGRKILALGEGDLDLTLLRQIRESGYKGPIGILGHTQDDVEERLSDNLDGLSWLVPQLDNKPAGPRPKYRTTTPAEPLSVWRSGVKVRPVSSDNHHSIHSYFNTSPESPDGRWVLYYASRTTNGNDGEIHIRERSTGTVKVLARDVAVEDAHRAACQQWVNGGRTVVFHNVLPSGEWVVMAVDVETSRQRILARGRQVGFGQPHAQVVPIYGPHWNPGPHRDLELVNVESGQITKSALTADAVSNRYGEWISREFKSPVSIYIPMLSPDLSRVFFKMATPMGGDFRSSKASKREGLLVYDLKASRFLTMQERWGHPAWHADSKRVLNVGGTITNVEDGKILRIPNYPKLPGSHPSFSPDGILFTSDLVTGPEKSWAVGVGNTQTGEFETLHTFDNSKGARSWRVSHPHPVFSADGRRLYFNVSADEWTRLYVAEAP